MGKKRNTGQAHRQITGRPPRPLNSVSHGNTRGARQECDTENKRPGRPSFPPAIRLPGGGARGLNALARQQQVTPQLMQCQPPPATRNLPKGQKAPHSGSAHAQQQAVDHTLSPVEPQYPKEHFGKVCNVGALHTDKSFLQQQPVFLGPPVSASQWFPESNSSTSHPNMTFPLAHLPSNQMHMHVSQLPSARGGTAPLSPLSPMQVSPAFPQNECSNAIYTRNNPREAQHQGRSWQQCHSMGRQEANETLVFCLTHDQNQSFKNSNESLGRTPEHIGMLVEPAPYQQQQAQPLGYVPSPQQFPLMAQGHLLPRVQSIPYYGATGFYQGRRLEALPQPTLNPPFVPRNHPQPTASTNEYYGYPLETNHDRRGHALTYNGTYSGPAATQPPQLQHHGPNGGEQYEYGPLSGASRAAQQRGAHGETQDWPAAAKAQRMPLQGDRTNGPHMSGAYYPLWENSYRQNLVMRADNENSSAAHRCRSATPPLVATIDEDESHTGTNTIAAPQTSPKRCFSLRKSAKPFVPNSARAWEFLSTAVNKERYLKRHGEGVVQLPQNERPAELRTPAPDEQDIWVCMGSKPALSGRDSTQSST